MNKKASEGKLLSCQNTTLDSNKVPMFNCPLCGCIYYNPIQVLSQLIPIFQWFLPELKLSSDK